MNLVKEILQHEVVPALGCTEPIAVALAVAKAKQVIGTASSRSPNYIHNIQVTVSAGVLKNGMGVTVPNSGGLKGCKIAAALGIFANNPSLGLELLQSITPVEVQKAQELIASDRVTVDFDLTYPPLQIVAQVVVDDGTGVAVIQGSHSNVTNVYYCSKSSSRSLDTNVPENTAEQPPSDTYMRQIAEASLEDMVQAARNIDDTDRNYIQQGVDMNLAVAEAGTTIGQYGTFMQTTLKQAGCGNDPANLTSNLGTSALVANATDARMSGVSLPVMSSGGSGNQGVVAILVPYHHGIKAKVNQRTIIESIALSHLLNTYVKAYLGKLSPICGCAIGAGIGAAAAIVYQAGAEHEDKIPHAVQNVIATISGILCDGAKSGCTLKVIAATDCAIASANFALGGHHATAADGIVGDTIRHSLENLGQLIQNTMGGVDSGIVSILNAKM